jgi:hypothetical protein
MVKEFEFYHGLVFARLIHNLGHSVLIEPYPTESNASYIINKEVGLYIKYSTTRMTPWSFSFKKEHQDEILDMKNKLGRVYIVFVCYDDGLACLSYSELKDVLNEKYEQTEWVRIARRSREKYTITGKDGKLKYKIGDNEFPRKIFSHISTNTHIVQA